MKWKKREYYMFEEEKENFKVKKNKKNKKYTKDKSRKKCKYLNQFVKKHEIYLIAIIIVIIFFCFLILLLKIINSKNKQDKKELNNNNKIQNKTIINTENIDIITNKTISVNNNSYINEIKKDIKNNEGYIQIKESINITKIKEKQEEIDNNNRKLRQIALDKGFEFIQKSKEGQLFNDKSKFKQNSNPKISAIMPVFNCADTLKAAVRSIQNQKMLDIEIILVNDNSDNKTVNLMKELQKEDPRILIINNNKTMVTFYSRAIGTLSSKGKYITDLDCDDMFINEDIFDIAYNSAEEGNFDVIAFNSFQSPNIDNKNIYIDVFTNKKDNCIIYQPELSCFCVSNNGTKEAVNDLYIWGKIFQSSIYKSALNMLGYEKYSTPLIWNEDYTQIFVIYNLAKSYKSINKYGYFHKVSSRSNSNRMKFQEKTFSDIFFDEIIFDFGKPFCKKISAQRLIGLKTYRSFLSLDINSKSYLYKLINKIINSKDIEEEYKQKLKESYRNIFPLLVSSNISNIRFLGK